MKHKIKLSEIKRYTHEQAEQITGLVAAAIQNQIGLTKHYDPKTGEVVDVLTIIQFVENEITGKIQTECFRVVRFDSENVGGLIPIEDFNQIEITDDDGNVLDHRNLPITAHSLFPHTHGPDCECEKSKLIELVETLMLPVLFNELDQVKETIDKINGNGNVSTWEEMPEQERGEIQKNLMGEVLKVLSENDPNKN